mmetsp:Transcript_18439/g.22691  ORF Transcript_18439/g.22691 Transcript_18439/m.22691 type:complete len:343 (-) Transcript_18439:335-1363(-)
MYHQNFVVDQMKQRQISEGLRKQVEEIQVVLRPCFSCKTIDHVSLQHFVIASVHENRIGIFHLHREDHHNHLNGPRATVDKVAIKQERRIRRGHAGHAENVHEVKVLAVNVAEDGQLLARTHLDSVHCLLRLKLSNDIENQQVSVLLRNEASSFLELHQPLQPCIINVSCLRVAGSIVPWSGLRHGHGSLAFLCKVLIRPATQPWHPSTWRCRWSSGCRLLHWFHFNVLDGRREGYLLVLSRTLSSSFEGSSRLHIRVWDEVLQKVHDVFKVPIADVRAIHRLDNVAFLHSCHCSLSERISRVSCLFVHVHDHGSFTVHAVSVPLDAARPLLELNCVSGTHR